MHVVVAKNVMLEYAFTYDSFGAAGSVKTM